MSFVSTGDNYSLYPRKREKKEKENRMSFREFLTSRHTGDSKPSINSEFSPPSLNVQPESAPNQNRDPQTTSSFTGTLGYKAGVSGSTTSLPTQKKFGSNYENYNTANPVAQSQPNLVISRKEPSKGVGDPLKERSLERNIKRVDDRGALNSARAENNSGAVPKNVGINLAQSSVISPGFQAYAQGNEKQSKANKENIEVDQLGRKPYHKNRPENEVYYSLDMKDMLSRRDTDSSISTSNQSLSTSNNTVSAKKVHEKYKVNDETYVIKEKSEEEAGDIIKARGHSILKERDRNRDETSANPRKHQNVWFKDQPEKRPGGGPLGSPKSENSLSENVKPNSNFTFHDSNEMIPKENNDTKKLEPLKESVVVLTSAKDVVLNKRNIVFEEDQNKSGLRGKVNSSPPPPEHISKRINPITNPVTSSMNGLNMTVGEKELHKKYITEKEKNKELEEKLIEKEKLIVQLKEYSKELAKNLDEREKQIKKLCVGGTSKYVPILKEESSALRADLAARDEKITRLEKIRIENDKEIQRLQETIEGLKNEKSKLIDSFRKSECDSDASYFKAKVLQDNYMGGDNNSEFSSNDEAKTMGDFLLMPAGKGEALKKLRGSSADQMKEEQNYFIQKKYNKNQVNSSVDCQNQSRFTMNSNYSMNQDFNESNIRSESSCPANKRNTSVSSNSSHLRDGYDPSSKEGMSSAKEKIANYNSSIILSYVKDKLNLKEFSEIPKKFDLVINELTNHKKFYESLAKVIIECSPVGTFRERPTLKQIWKWIKNLMEEYMNLKMDSRKRSRSKLQTIKETEMENPPDENPIYRKEPSRNSSEGAASRNGFGLAVSGTSVNLKDKLRVKELEIK